MRAFANQSILVDGSLALALAPALTPEGINDNPCFFKGFAAYPQVLARGLLVLADITSTRYFKYTPVAQRDPILSAQGDRLRAECFSACNGVYARLDLFQSGFNGQIGFGTTNVDIGIKLRSALTQVKQQDKLHLNIGDDGLVTSHLSQQDDKTVRLEDKVHQRPVEMPDRWVRALGNAAEIHKTMKPVFSLKATVANSEAPPVWVNRVLDVTLRIAPYLREAAKRGLIAKEDARWPGLSDIALSKSKSTAIAKAKKLMTELGIVG